MCVTTIVTNTSDTNSLLIEVVLLSLLRTKVSFAILHLAARVMMTGRCSDIRAHATLIKHRPSKLPRVTHTAETLVDRPRCPYTRTVRP